MGKSPSVQDIHDKGSVGQRSSQVNNMSEYDQRRSELSMKYKKSVSQRDIYNKLDKIKGKVHGQNILSLKVVLQSMGELEGELENMKQKIVAEREEYNTIDAFRFIDEDGNGAVTPDELVNFLGAVYGQHL